MACDDRMGASFLVQLKSRNMTSDLLEEASHYLAKMLKKQDLDPGLLIPGSISTQVINSCHFISRKNDTLNMGGIYRGLPLALPEDSRWLSDLQCFVRAYCCEFFTAADGDTKNNSKACSKRYNRYRSPASDGQRCPPRAKSGQVGIRCVFCRSLPPCAKAAQSVSFPSRTGGIYGAVVMMQCRHFPNCVAMPPEVRETLNNIKGRRNVSPPPGSLPAEGGCVEDTNFFSSSSHGCAASGRQRYWAESARRLGLIDTPNGIRVSSAFAEGLFSTPTADVIDSHRVNADMTGGSNNHQDKRTTLDGQTSETKHIRISPEFSSNNPELLFIPNLSLPSSLFSIMGEALLVTPDDKDLVPDYLFLAMAQMRPCALNESDRVGCYKDRELGFKGMCCKHCGGQPGFGKYFPATVRSLAQTTTSQTIVKHVGAKCRMCPTQVRTAVLSLQQNSLNNINGGCNYSRGPSPSNDGRPKYGSRKVFFQRVWARLQGEDVPEIPKFEAAPIPIAVGHESSDKACSSQEQTSKPLNNEASISEVDDDFGDDILSTRFFPSEDELEADGDDANVGYTAMDSNSGCRIPTRSSFRHGSRLVDDISSKRKAIGKNHKMSKRFKRVLLDSK